MSSATRPAALKLLMTLKRLRLDPGSTLAWEISNDVANLEAAIREDQAALLRIDEKGERAMAVLDRFIERLNLTASPPSSQAEPRSDLAPENSRGSAPTSVLDDYAEELRRLNEDGPSDAEIEGMAENIASHRASERRGWQP